MSTPRPSPPPPPSARALASPFPSKVTITGFVPNTPGDLPASFAVEVTTQPAGVALVGKVYDVGASGWLPAGQGGVVNAASDPAGNATLPFSLTGLTYPFACLVKVYYLDPSDPATDTSEELTVTRAAPAPGTDGAATQA